MPARRFCGSARSGEDQLPKSGRREKGRGEEEEEEGEVRTNTFAVFCAPVRPTPHAELMAGAGGSPTALPEIGAVTAHVAAPIAHVSHVIVASEGAASRRTGGEQTGRRHLKVRRDWKVQLAARTLYYSTPMTLERAYNRGRRSRRCHGCDSRAAPLLPTARPTCSKLRRASIFPTATALPSGAGCWRACSTPSIRRRSELTAAPPFPLLPQRGTSSATRTRIACRTTTQRVLGPRGLRPAGERARARASEWARRRLPPPSLTSSLRGRRSRTRAGKTSEP